MGKVMQYSLTLKKNKLLTPCINILCCTVSFYLIHKNDEIVRNCMMLTTFFLHRVL